ncbi:hypothetical protein EON63_04140 [archaeon]|nr:MAG: hypothetical protein EON63_04140 [archaeon]
MQSTESKSSKPEPTSLEWRIFVPCHPFPELSSHVPSPEADRIFHDILSTITSLKPAAAFSETRTDTYIIAERYFGLKFREGEKLELKTRLHRSDDLGIEEYRKVKYGKKDIKKYEDEIIQELNYCGYTHDAIHRVILQTQRSLDIKKSRVNVQLGNVYVEVANIEFVLPCEAPKHWLSLAIEAHSKVDINSFVASNILIRRLLASINTYIHIARQNPAQPMTLPILGGYPSFVFYVSAGCDRELALDSFATLIGNR